MGLVLLRVSDLRIVAKKTWLFPRNSTARLKSRINSELPTKSSLTSGNDGIFHREQLQEV